MTTYPEGEEVPESEPVDPEGLPGSEEDSDDDDEIVPLDDEPIQREAPGSAQEPPQGVPATPGPSGAPGGPQAP